MIEYIGDISKNDAEVLSFFAEEANKILEFGCGASTQVLIAYSKGQVTSIDTSPEWIQRTSKNIFDLSRKGQIAGNKLVDLNISDYDTYMSFIKVNNLKYDFIFDDGVDNLRRDFAWRIWTQLNPDGFLAFHDTRRPHDFRNVLEFLADHMDEIDTVYFNHMHSNITIIKKKMPEPYDNWQISENRTPEQLGY